MSHSQIAQPVPTTQNRGRRGAELPYLLLFLAARFPDQDTNRDAFLVNVNATATGIQYVHTPSPLQQRQGHLIQNSLSYVLPIEDEGYSSLFITVSGLN
jgi:hypothetical protein